MNTYLQCVARRWATLYSAIRKAGQGQGLVEYAAILGFIACLVVVAIHFLEPAISTSINNVANSFTP